MPKVIRRLLVIGTETRYGQRVVSGIHAYCRRHGSWEYHLEDKMGFEAAGRVRFAIREWKPDGIIALLQYPVIEKLIRESGLPAVNFSGSYSTRLPSVMSDSVEIGRVGARHFLSNGLRHFAFSARSIEPSSRERCDGFLAEIAKAGLKCEVFSDEFSGQIEHDWVKNRRRMEQWLQRLPKPVAIMCINDIRGQELSRMCRRVGLRVPDDVALLSVGNDETLCQMCTPPLSSVATDAEKIGYEAAGLIDRMMRTGKRPTGPVLVPPRHVASRASSDVVAVDDAEVAAAVRFIRDHAHEQISVKDVLNLVPISRRALERRFEQAVGRTPKAEIIRVRMERAKTLLGETDLPVSSIAKETGFSGQEKFSAAFHRECGLTPTDYRRNGRVVRSNKT